VWFNQRQAAVQATVSGRHLRQPFNERFETARPRMTASANCGGFQNKKSHGKSRGFIICQTSADCAALLCAI